MRLQTRISAVASALLTAVSFQSFNIALAHGFYAPTTGQARKLHLGHQQVTQQSVQVNYINIIDFGADPTGSHDSTAQIQNAANQAVATGKNLFVPAGTFLRGQLNFSGVHVFGVGSASVLLANPASPTSTAVIFNGNAPASLSNLVVSTQGIKNTSSTLSDSLSNVTFQGTTGGVNINSVTILQGPGVPGAVVDGSSNVGIVSVGFNGIGTQTQGAGVWINNSQGVYVGGNSFQNLYQDVVTAGNSSNITITGNVMGTPAAPTIAGGVVISDSTGVNVLTNSIQMANSQFATLNAAVVATGQSSGITVANNNTNKGYYGDYFASSVAGSSNSVSSNSINNTGGPGVVINNTAQSTVSVTNNVFGQVEIINTAANSAVVLGVGSNLGNVSGMNNVYTGNINNNLTYFFDGSGQFNASKFSGNTASHVSLVALH